MDTLISSYILPIFGIGIVVFCILSFIFPYGSKFKEKTQKIKGFGLDLEVSVLTLFIIVGVIMSFIGVYLQIKNYEQQLDNSRRGEEAAKIALEQARKREITFVVTLEDVSENDMPKLEDTQCKYLLFGSDKPVRVDVTKGYRSDQFKIILRNLKSDAHIARLELEDLFANRKWIKESFMPFEPNFRLTKE